MLHILRCLLSVPDLIYISLLIIFCIIEYVTNKKPSTLNLVSCIIFFRKRYLFSVPFWIKTPTHTCTLYPLHRLEHYIYFHDLPFSLLSALVYLKHLQNFWWFSCRFPRTRAGLCPLGRNDPDCCVTVGVMFCFACFSGIFLNHKIYIRRKLWCLMLSVCHFHVHNCYYLTIPW